MKTVNGISLEYWKMIRASDEFKKKLKNTLEITDGWIQNGIFEAHKEYYSNVRELLYRFAEVIKIEEKSDIIRLETDDELNADIYDRLRKVFGDKVEE